jgi:hypothetical protein
LSDLPVFVLSAWFRNFLIIFSYTQYSPPKTRKDLLQ